MFYQLIKLNNHADSFSYNELCLAHAELSQQLCVEVECFLLERDIAL